MLASSPQDSNPRSLRSLRSACDLCHQTKVKCSGGRPCDECKTLGAECSTSFSNRIGRPKGTRNKKTLDRIQRLQANARANTSQLNKQNCRIEEGASITPPRDESMAPEFASQNYDQIVGQDSYSADYLCLEASSGNNTFSFTADHEEIWSSFETVDAPHSSDASNEGWQPKEDSDTSKEEGLWSLAFGPTNVNPEIKELIPEPLDETSYMIQAGSLDDDKGLDLEPIPFSRYLEWNFIENHEALDEGVFSTSATTSPAGCNCLEYQAMLFCRLNSLKKQHVSLRVDFVLATAQQALAAWKSFSDCGNCYQDKSQDVSQVLDLLVMNFCTTLQIVRDVCFKDHEDERHHIRPTSNQMRSTIGVYEVDDEETNLVANLLVSRTIDKVGVILGQVKDKLDDVKKRIMSSPTPFTKNTCIDHGISFDIDTSLAGIDHRQRMIAGLENTVHILKRQL